MMESPSIPAAVRALRARLDETQAGMARLLGVPLRTYHRWEAGDTTPRGNKLVRLIDFCPDDHTRSLFRAAVESSTSKSSGEGRTPRAMHASPQEKLRIRLRNSCREAIEIIYESARLGSAVADEQLRNYAEELNRNALTLAKDVAEYSRDVAT
jgi:DNA-binding XRE family transcriptional regulator